MTPSSWPRPVPEDERLLFVDPASASLLDRHVRDLPGFIRTGDLLVVNDAATLPASLSGITDDGRSIELRLLGAPEGDRARAVLFGAGDWRTPTEHRPLPAIAAGDRVRIGDDLSLRIVEVQSRGRLADIVFDRDGADLLAAIYKHGRPVQYAYVERALELWHVQNRYASRPWAAELPSAGHVLTWGVLSDVRKRGANVAWITHAAGLSSTGDEELDRLLPLPEHYDVPQSTVSAIVRTKEQGGRVIAAGTSVVRALEGAALAGDGRLAAGEGVTSLRIDGDFRPQIVDGILTGMHELGASHRDLLAAFAPRRLLERAYAFAEELGYQGHEFGDVSLILAA